ncbi:MAG: YidC/Oxa1 family insertase periplasmic-domain containing protein [Phycisphaerales bacterium JB039]
MANKPNTTARILVPLIVGAIGLLAAWALMQSAAPTKPAQQGQLQPEAAGPEAAQSPPAEQPGAGPAQPEAEPAEPPALSAQPDAPPAEPAPGADAAEQPQLRIEPVEPAAFTPLGGLDPETDRIAIRFSDLGAGIESIQLADYFETVRHREHVTIQEEHVSDTGARLTPLAAFQVQINGAWIDIATAPGGAPAWRELAPGVFEAHIVDDSGERIARIERSYEIIAGTHAIRLRQSVANLTDEPMTVAWRQVGPADLFADRGGYGGDKRRVRFGYVAPNSPGFVASSDYLLPRAKAAGSPEGATQLLAPLRQVWPDARAANQGYQISWLGMTNRYFGAAVYPVQPDGAPSPAQLLPEAQLVERVTLNRASAEAPIALLLTSAPQNAAPGAAAAFDVNLYTGPLEEREIDASPGAEVVNLHGLVQYNFGGPCAFCTFGWITHALIGLLDLLHNYVVFDWGLAIILLVVCVRTILHPVTKWSQVRLTRFGKQMQEMAPKQKKLQEKYKDDPKKMQQAMRDLWREEGVNPAGALGCLPMFLQTPVWIALYASLYFAVQLRHEPAFFGVFQNLTGGAWEFMADLSRPDGFIPLPTSFTLPLMGEISSLNILPLLLGVVFYVHQKYLSPPTTATMTPEQEQTQKMVKIMMVVMFPVIMYNAPSGLALYFIANSTLGIFESRYIRAHVTKMDLEPKKKGQTFFQRLMEQAERRRQMLETGAAPKGKSFGRPGAPGRPGQRPGKKGPRR